MKSVVNFLTVETVGFALAALVHAGVLLNGYEHRKAMIAESVIAVVLAAGLAASLAAPAWSRRIGLGVQAFALLGTFVGLFTIAVGVGPQSTFDLLLHGAFIIVLVAGLTAVARSVPAIPQA